MGKERILDINKHNWEWTNESQSVYSELTGVVAHCEYCGAEIENNLL